MSDNTEPMMDKQKDVCPWCGLDCDDEKDETCKRCGHRSGREALDCDCEICGYLVAPVTTAAETVVDVFSQYTSGQIPLGSLAIAVMLLDCAIQKEKRGKLSTVSATPSTN